MIQKYSCRIPSYSGTGWRRGDLGRLPEADDCTPFAIEISMAATTLCP